MAVNAHDVKIFAWKMIKLSSKTCFNLSIKHPYITSCSFILLLLYLCSPPLFKIVLYSLPLAVSVWAALKISRFRHARREKEKEKEKEKKAKIDSKDHRKKVAFTRVHSVRRRKAKEITIKDEAEEPIDEEEEEEEEEINIAIPPPLPEKAAESPKEIHQVEVEVELTHEFHHDPDLMRCLKLLREDEDTRDEANKAMDAGISDAERSKRLESLIARRKLRKELNQQVRSQIAPMVNLPKISTWCSPSRSGGGPFSPVPGSAPTVMVPTRSPFDLPYDPLEEKLDLTGDSFHQEFALGHGRDMMFCRHESFSLGTSLPMEFFDDRDDVSSLDELGFRRRHSPVGDRFSKPENEESDTDLGRTTDVESDPSNNDNDDDHDDDENNDQIKEAVKENRHRAEGFVKKPSARDGMSLNSNSNSNSNSSSNSSSRDSSDDERPVRIINREAILKSLSIRRNSIDIDTNENLQENNLTYANSALENASRLKQEYFAHKPPKRHRMTFSIASDMQVEVSEISSPPLTIDENISNRDDASAFDGEMDRNTSWDGLDSWAGSSRLSEVSDNETRPARATEAGPSRDRAAPLSERHPSRPSSSADEISNNGESQTDNLPEQNDERVQRMEGEDEATTNPAARDQEPVLHHTTISPKSVLHPALSEASFEPDGDDEAHLSRTQSTPQNPTPLLQFTFGASSSGDAQASQESFRPPSNASTSGAKDTESSASTGKQKILENETQEPRAHTVDEKMKTQVKEIGDPIRVEDTGHERESSKPEDLERQTEDEVVDRKIAK